MHRPLLALGGACLVFVAACSSGHAGESSIGRDGGAPRADAGKADFGADPDTTAHVGDEADPGTGPETDDTDPELPACGPHNCDGCCDGATCVGGGSDDACGRGGAPCRACGPWGECDDMAMCVIAPESRWDIVVESADVPASRRDGSGWEDGETTEWGDPDVYVRLRAHDPVADEELSEANQSTASRSPAWDSPLATNVRGAALEGMVIELLDHDTFSSDDRMGPCHAAPRLEDLDSGTVELDCPQSHGERSLFAMPRAGWALRYRLEPRSDPRPGAAPLDSASAAAAGPVGACTRSISHARDAERPHDIVELDERGRVVRTERWLPGNEEHDIEESTTTRQFACTEDGRYCENVSGGFYVNMMFRRLEPGPAGLRPRVEDGRWANDPDGFTEYPLASIERYDGLGRRVASKTYDHHGKRTGVTEYRYSIGRLDVYRSGRSEAQSSTEFDDYGRPIYFEEGSTRYAVETNADGLPVKRTIVETDSEYVEVGDGTYFVEYDGDGCSAVARRGWTNGPVLAR